MSNNYLAPTPKFFTHLKKIHSDLKFRFEMTTTPLDKDEHEALDVALTALTTSFKDAGYSQCESCDDWTDNGAEGELSPKVLCASCGREARNNDETMSYLQGVR